MVTDAVKIKKNTLVFFKKFISKKYNEESKKNLVQYQKTDNKILTKLNKQKKVDDINAFTETFKAAYQSATQKNYKTSLSKQQASKISEITNVFIQSILSEFISVRGFSQRSVSFVTLTLPSTQMHTDKEIIKTFVKFVDHLKKVKNYTIENGRTTKNEALPLKNYLWRAETQENGNIHFHLLFDTFFNHQVLKRVWNGYLNNLGYINGENSASIHSIKNLNDVGAYVTKYMTKEPLNDKYSDMLKDGKISYSELNSIPDSEKYRRTIIGKTWGCSRSVMALRYCTFEGSEVNKVTREMLPHMQAVELPETCPDFIKVFKGNVKKVLRKCSYKFQAYVKNYYKFVHQSLYNSIQTIQEINTEMEKDRFDELLKLGDLDHLFFTNRLKDYKNYTLKPITQNVFRFPND